MDWWVDGLKTCHDHITPLLRKLDWLPVAERSFIFIFNLANPSFPYFDGVLQLYLSFCLSSIHPPDLFAFVLKNLRWFWVSTWKVLVHASFKTRLQLCGIHYHWISTSPRRCHPLNLNLKHTSSSAPFCDACLSVRTPSTAFIVYWSHWMQDGWMNRICGRVCFACVIVECSSVGVYA